MVSPSQSIVDQVSRLSEVYPCMSFDSKTKTVTMPYRLNAEYSRCQIVEDYQLRIVLNDGYPEALPSVYEESGKICDEFEHRLPDGSLCIGVPGELLMGSNGTIELVDYIDGPIKCCLYSAAYLERYGKYPFGERRHGVDGILEYYCELFRVGEPQSALDLMRAVVAGATRGCDKCPCGSGRQTWNCHSQILNELKSEFCRRAIGADLKSIDCALEIRDKWRASSRLIRLMWRDEI